MENELTCLLCTPDKADIDEMGIRTSWGLLFHFHFSQEPHWPHLPLSPCLEDSSIGIFAGWKVAHLQIILPF
jgi:hypothetical protein